MNNLAATFSGALHGTWLGVGCSFGRGKVKLRYAILICAVVAAVITSTPNATSLLLFMAPMIALYELGIAAKGGKRWGQWPPWRTATPSARHFA
jgi:hypothetical protein